jgi:WD40 repeat protein
MVIGSSPVQPEGPIASSDIPPDTIAIVAHSNGEASIVSLASPNPTIRSLVAGKSPLYAVAYDNARQFVATGSRDGTISLFDLYQASPSMEDLYPFITFSRSTAPIISLSFCSSHQMKMTLVIGAEDGLPCRVLIDVGASDDAHKVRVMEEYAGLDCDSALAREGHGGSVWVGAGDGKLRRYDVV